MEMTPLVAEAVPDVPPGSPQSPAFQPGPSLLGLEAQIKATVDAAENRGDDFLSLKVGDIQKPQSPAGEPSKAPLDVPEKFKTPTGEVDVEKLKASTRQLDEAIKTKETAIEQTVAEVAQPEKTVDDYLKEYRASEAKFRNLPNPEKFDGFVKQSAEQPPVSSVPAQVPQQMSRDELEARINADFQRNPAQTMAEIVDIIVNQKLNTAIKPLEEGVQLTLKEREDNRIRGNLQDIAKKDPRVLRGDVFAAINAKLVQDPDLWKLKNPHKAAWLEVKDEMRLGEPSSVQAQPSRPPSPILGGGTPPPPQSSSSSGVINKDSLLGALKQFDPKNSGQFNSVEKAFKEYMDKEFRAGR